MFFFFLGFLQQLLSEFFQTFSRNFSQNAFFDNLKNFAKTYQKESRWETSQILIGEILRRASDKVLRNKDFSEKSFESDPGRKYWGNHLEKFRKILWRNPFRDNGPDEKRWRTILLIDSIYSEVKFTELQKQLYTWSLSACGSPKKLKIALDDYSKSKLYQKGIWIG